jgi:hypothetical protein
MYNNINIPLMVKISRIINTRQTAVLCFEPHTLGYLPFCRYCNETGKFEARTSQAPSTNSINSVT